MIKISEYRMMLADMAAGINSGLSGETVNIVPVLSADETSFCKSLKERTGIVIGGQYPGADAQNAEQNNISPEHPCLLFVLKKIDSSAVTDIQMEQYYDHIGEIADALMNAIADSDFGCSLSSPVTFGGSFHFEWEYNYNGFYGCSISFNLK